MNLKPVAQKLVEHIDEPMHEKLLDCEGKPVEKPKKNDYEINVK
jgi:hypothetical protein